MQGRDALLKIRGDFPPNSDLVPFSSFATARSGTLTSHLLPLEDHLRLGAPGAILMISVSRFLLLPMQFNVDQIAFLWENLDLDLRNPPKR